tara:strand:- start:835 stop:1191 length:357 start_codon:yes stop_codon:yes gene_type:complete
MPANKAEWTNVALTAATVLGVAFGGYGHFSGVMANQEARITVLEKEQQVSHRDRDAMDNELDVLWVDTSKNKDGIKTLQKGQERADRYFEKFANAVDRLSISVARLEEHMNSRDSTNE